MGKSKGKPAEAPPTAEGCAQRLGRSAGDGACGLSAEMGASLGLDQPRPVYLSWEELCGRR